jgi:hypothetical protein
MSNAVTSPISTTLVTNASSGLSAGEIGAIAGSISGVFIIAILTAGAVFMYKMRLRRTALPPILPVGGDRFVDEKGRGSQTYSQRNPDTAEQVNQITQPTSPDLSGGLRYPEGELLDLGRTEGQY